MLWRAKATQNSNRRNLSEELSALKAAIYVLCKSKEEIANPFDSEEEGVSSFLLEENESGIPVTLGIDQYAAKLANMAKIDTEVERLAIEIAQKSNNHLLADGKSPNGLAATYIYIAAILLGVNLLKIDLSNLAGLTEVAIRNRCKDILTSFKLTIKVKLM